MFCQKDDPYAQQQPRERHLAIFYNLNHSKVKIYSYDALKKVLPKNHDKKICQIFPLDTIFKLYHILIDKVQKVSGNGLEPLLEVVIKILCDMK